ncbi:MAG: glycosyltransferase family 2 protein [Chloroflexi bacterium]|nr:glycosyltransferase family 2 protein [Chloroflexota bacterium]
MPAVSVVMPVYNGECYLAEAIESILGQTFTDFEFIIVDDGSRDGSAAIIHDFAKRDERIRVIQHERNRGLTSARNSGIAASRGQFVAAMDHDDISLPRRIEKQADFLHSHPRLGLVGTHVRTLLPDLSVLRIDEFPQCHAEIVLL